MPGVLERVKIFDKPFAYTVLTYQAEQFCSYCLRVPEGGKKLLSCSGCRFARYCDKSCQRLAWKDHKPECARLRSVFPNLPMTEVLFLGRLMDKVAFLKLHGDIHNWQSDRNFCELLGHDEEIREDQGKMFHFEKIYTKTSKYFGEKMIPKEEFFSIFCKACINSHSIHTSAGTEIGMSLDLGVSMYDHSCRPNCTMVFDGFRTLIRPLDPRLDVNDTRRAFISYIDVGRSRYQRKKDLKAKWYFDCQCSRCLDWEDDDRLTSIQCVNPECEEAIHISEDSTPKRIHCPKCRSITEPERIIEAQDFMKSLPQSFHIKQTKEDIERYTGLLEKASKILHQENIYYNRLLMVCFDVQGGKPMAPNMHKMLYNNYRRCLPEADRHVGYQLLHLVKSLIEQKKREEAVSYAFEAMQIFEICFGLDHPYYLQTLALWTFLDKHPEKTDDQLLVLMNFSNNRPVNISSFLDNVSPQDAQENLQLKNLEESEA